ncbi:hypothetical protein DCAR_0418319 [Daucus carota subsp. sativus]|uniref:WPP domain-containing protein n=1 Tax=Daucus carota subsp. sativus TaxID=79200 RepID=A0A165ZBG9_DAUCS|nr:PREDICTED: MFP1 attachment factor 1-like [Daucus carota subsp. sativus]WOG98973.1 hypothetical protein DCAR_0418319 [Daucus carota subsp. sativus]
MADTQEQAPNAEISKSEKPSISFSIWPPSQRTRDAVISRLIETLSSPSVLSKRYGTLPEAEAAATAKIIEEEAFAAASSSAASDDDGIEILQGYSKEISKRMLETVKSRSGGTGGEKASEGHVAEEVKVEQDESSVTESN